MVARWRLYRSKSFKIDKLPKKQEFYFPLQIICSKRLRTPEYYRSKYALECSAMLHRNSAFLYGVRRRNSHQKHTHINVHNRIGGCVVVNKGSHGLQGFFHAELC